MTANFSLNIVSIVHLFTDSTPVPWPAIPSLAPSIVLPTRAPLRQGGTSIPPVPTFSTLTTTTKTMTPQPILTTSNPSPSLCGPISPCGEHGTCIESTSATSTRRFACVCSENWFGRLCDRNIEECKVVSSWFIESVPFLSYQWQHQLQDWWNKMEKSLKKLKLSPHRRRFHTIRKWNFRDSNQSRIFLCMMLLLLIDANESSTVD